MVLGTPLDIQLNGDRCWPDIDRDKLIPANIAGIAVLTNATEGGKPSVTVRINLADGRVVLAQTTLALMLMALDAIKVRHGDPRHG